jgi:hypothetical protein
MAKCHFRGDNMLNQYHIGEKVTVCEYSYNAPTATRGEEGVIIDVSGSSGSDPNCYTIVFERYGTLYLTDSDIKPLLAQVETEEAA